MTRFRFVEAEAAQFPVSLLCRVVGVTRQGYYAWKRRPPSARELADRKLCERIREIYVETEEIYGAPRIYSELKLGDGIRGRQEAGRSVDAPARHPWRRRPPRRAAHDRPRPEARLGAGPRRPRLRPGASRTGSGSATSSTSRPGRASSSSPPSRTSSAAGSSAGRCATTSRPSSSSTRSGWPSPLAALTPPASWRIRITGRNTQVWSTAPTPSSPGSTSRWARSATPGTTPLAESFFASLEKELLRRERFATREQARLRVFWYIECFYNPRRRHSSLGMLSPIDYEQRHQQEAIAA